VFAGGGYGLADVWRARIESESRRQPRLLPRGDANALAPLLVYKPIERDNIVVGMRRRFA
jgi:hypothetical protein